MFDVALIRKGLFNERWWVRALSILAICLVAGLPIGMVLGLADALYGTAILIGLLCVLAVLRYQLVGLLALIAVICLLPFAALPFDIGFSPTFLDIVLIAVFFVWIMRLATRKQSDFIAAPPTVVVVMFMLLACMSFVAGLSHSALTTTVLRHFAELMLSVLVFVLVINTVRDRKQLNVLVIALMAAGALAALIGIVLYVMPDYLANRILSMLDVVRYPSGDVLRYVEDDTSLAERAISTSVDPNVFGGMLVIVSLITTAQLFAVQPLLKRGWIVAMLLPLVVCLILTYSRGSFVGYAFGVFLLAVLRYPRLLIYAVVGAVFLLLLPPAQEYVQHFMEGIAGEDLATQMRFGEYIDAIEVIGRQPWLGVGFGDTPYIDTYLGVSCVYLLIGEEMGIPGVALFLLAMGSFMASFARARRVVKRDSSLEAIMYGTALAIAGALFSGIFDHYFFNADFPHAAALFWFVVGLAAVSFRLIEQEASEKIEDRVAPVV